MAKLLLILFCCCVWVAADPFFFNIQKSYISQPSYVSTSRPVTSQSTNLGTGGIFSKWLLLSQIFTNKLVGAPTQRPRPTQRPVVQIDPVYVPVDLDKEYASTTSTEVPAEEIDSTKKSTTSTTSSYEYSSPSTTETTTTSFSFSESTSATSESTTDEEIFIPTTHESTSSTSESTTDEEIFIPTTYRPITNPTTQSSTTTTTTTEISETDIGYEVDSSEQDKPNEIIEPSATSTTTEEYSEGVEPTETTVSLPLTYLPPVIKSRRLSLTSAGLAATGSISSGTPSANTISTGFAFSDAAGEGASEGATSSESSSTSGNARPLNLVSFRSSIADNFDGDALIEEAKSVELSESGINPRVFYYY